MKKRSFIQLIMLISRRKRWGYVLSCILTCFVCSVGEISWIHRLIWINCVFHTLPGIARKRRSNRLSGKCCSIFMQIWRLPRICLLIMMFIIKKLRMRITNFRMMMVFTIRLGDFSIIMRPGRPRLGFICGRESMRLHWNALRFLLNLPALFLG